MLRLDELERVVLCSPAGELARFLHQFLALYADNEERVAWPGLETLAADTGTERSSVAKALQALDRQQLVSVNATGGGKASGGLGGNTTRRAVALPDAEPELALPQAPHFGCVRSVLRGSRSRGLARRVLFALALTADPESGLASEGRELLAAVAGCQPSKASKAIAGLVEAGEVELVERGGGRGHRTVWRIRTNTIELAPDGDQLRLPDRDRARPTAAGGHGRANGSATTQLDGEKGSVATQLEPGNGSVGTQYPGPNQVRNGVRNPVRNGSVRTQEEGKMEEEKNDTPLTPRKRGAGEPGAGNLRRRERNPRALGTNPRALDRAARRPPPEVEQRWQAVVAQAADRLGSRADAFLLQVHYLELGWRDQTLLVNGPTRSCIRERYGWLLDELAAVAGLSLEPLEPERNRRWREAGWHRHVA